MRSTPLADARGTVPDDETLLDPGAAADAIGFVRHSLRRHRALAFLILLGTVAMGVIAAVALPRHFIISTKMMADKNLLMPALIEHRDLSSEADAPTRLATEAVMNRDNLLAIVRETKLVHSWPAMQSPIGRLRERVTRLSGGSMSDSAREEALVDLLRSRMSVETSEGTVSIELDWMDAGTGYRLVQAAQRHFFDQRRASQVAMIEESIRILEEHVATAQQTMQDVLATMPRVARPADLMDLESRRQSSAPSQSVELATLLALLEAKTRTIEALEATKNERVSALQSRVIELHGHFGPAHPEIVALESSIRSLSADSPRMRDLRAEEAALRTRITALGGTPAPAQATGSGADPGSATMMRLLRGSDESRDGPALTYAKSRLKIATAIYEEMLGRLEGARLGLETATAGFKYRYTIVTPPELPTRPTKPKVPLLLAGSLFLGMMLALFVAVGLDVSQGCILQSWQISRQLRLPVLTQIHA